MVHRKLYVVLFTSLLLLCAICILQVALVFFLKNGAGSKGKPGRLFGATYMTMDNQYFEILNTAIDELLEANGDRLVTRDPANMQSKQNEQILDMIIMGVEMIFINPVDKDAVVPALETCRQRGVPFILVDTSISQKDLALCTIASDNYQAGCLVAQEVMRQKNRADIVILYDKDIESTSSRLQGFLNTLNDAAFPYNIVYTAAGTTLLHETMVEMQRFLDLGVRFDVVFGSNDPSALGALAAIQNNRLNAGQLVYGIDGSPSGKMMVQQHLLEATVAQFPMKMAQQAVQTAYEYLAGSPVPTNIVMPVELITKENIERFNVLGWQ